MKNHEIYKIENRQNELLNKMVYIVATDRFEYVRKTWKKA